MRDGSWMIETPRIPAVRSTSWTRGRAPSTIAMMQVEKAAAWL